MKTATTSEPTLGRAEIESIIANQVAKLDAAALRKTYYDQDEFLILDNFLPPEIMAQWDAQLSALRPRLHRSFIPKHKKGGSVAYDTVCELAPAMNAVYQSPALLGLLKNITDAEMKECPDSDLHRCALYAYTEEGDHIGWHYDTSYYKDRRWTLLVGFRDNSSARLVCKLHTKNPGHKPEELSLQVPSGTLVLFNGDKVYHAVTPTKANEERFMVSMQYVTSGEMNPFMRFVSNMKDSIAYFGLKHVFLGGKKKP
ncbi:MAG: 2OG-Fe(II) oxygenase [Verrucomicrobiae bacterium]|nr:2OG-Fe(II) oxygenase [Verrucomicrobiae bacterium]